MKTTIKIILSLMVFVPFGCEDINDTSAPFGPFNPVSNVEDIIILGDNSTFVAFNVKTKIAEVTYKIPKGFVDEYAYLSGHLLLTVRGGDRYNINIATGEVAKHSIPYSAIGYYAVHTKKAIEATENNYFATYRYDPVKNKMLNTYRHPVQKDYWSFCIERNDTIYWSSHAFEADAPRCLINSYGQTLDINTGNNLETFVLRNNNFVTHILQKKQDHYKNMTVTLEKIEKLYPLKTVPFFKYPDEASGGISDTMLYKDKVLVFCNSETYLVDSTGKILYRWGDYIDERDYSLDYKHFNGRISKTIIGNKLYVYGTRYNSQTQVQKNCCVEIDLETGKDQWIEVWEGW